MTTTLAATCVDGVVKVLGVTVPDAHILSEGIGASTGTLLVFGGEAYYIARTSPDLDTTLQKIITALEKTKDALDSAVGALNSHDNAGFLIAATAGVPSPPLAALDISDLASAADDIENVKEELETLKDSLR